jgi:hypothetical protein
MKTPGTLLKISLTIGFAAVLSGALCQTTEEYFSREGLSINTVHINQYSGQTSNSWTFYKKDTLCGSSVLMYVQNSTGMRAALEVDGQRVYGYRFPHTCEKQLLYDFGLQVGDPVGNSHVSKVYQVDLENGEVRLAIDIANSYGELTGTWIEGIGNIHVGLFRQADFEGYDRFVCAKQGDDLLFVQPEFGHLCD